eukprot:PhF_6_TR38673/c0_g1_i2/m.57852
MSNNDLPSSTGTGTSSSANSPKNANVRTNKPYTYSSGTPHAASPLGVFQISSHNDPNAVGHAPDGDSWGAPAGIDSNSGKQQGSGAVAGNNNGNDNPGSDQYHRGGGRGWSRGGNRGYGRGGNYTGGRGGNGGNFGFNNNGWANNGFSQNGGYNSYSRGGFGFNSNRGGNNGGLFYPNNNGAYNTNNTNNNNNNSNT